MADFETEAGSHPVQRESGEGRTGFPVAILAFPRSKQPARRGDVLLFGIGSPVVIDVEESLYRAGVRVAAGIRNHTGPSNLSVEIPLIGPSELSTELLDLPFLVPLFTPAHRLSAAREAGRLGLWFNPRSLWETGFRPGRHAAHPVGNLRLPARDEVMLWHYKHLGFERNAAREAAQRLRLGPGDVAKSLGQQYRQSKDQLRAFWDEMEREATDLSVDDFAPDRACVGPLWWRTHPGLSLAEKPRMMRGATQPTVSVLVKAYNHAPYIRQTIDSVLAQSFQDFEIVVTDDGSTDETLAILQSFSDPRIRLEASPRNMGISAAMNATVARARGRYLAILNSDDWALPERLRRQVAFLDANPHISLVFGLPQPVDEAGEPATAFNDFRHPLTFPDYSRRSWLRQFFFHGNCLCAPTAMIRHEAYSAAGPYETRFTNLQDLDMWVRMLIAGHNIHLLSDEVTAFRIRDHMANMSAPRLDARLRSSFEMTRILKHFATLDRSVFEEVFGQEATELSFRPGTAVATCIAEIARRHPSTEHQNFALNLLYEIAKAPEDLIRLSELAGCTDVLGIDAISQRDRTILGLTEKLAKRTQRVEEVERTLAEWELLAFEIAHDLALNQQATAKLDSERQLNEARAAALRRQFRAASDFRLQVLESRSWRLTAFPRWVGQVARGLKQ